MTDKKEERAVLCAPQAGNQPAGNQATLLASFPALCRDFLPCIFYSLLLFKRPVDAGERRMRDGGVCMWGSIKAQLILSGLCMQLKT